MTKKESVKLTKKVLHQWMERNADSGVLPCIPVLLINSLCGDKPGITMNITQNIALEHIASILQSALAQVEAKQKEQESN